MRLTRRGTRGSELGSSAMTRVESRGGSVTTPRCSTLSSKYLLSSLRALNGRSSSLGDFELGGASILVGGFSTLFRRQKRQRHPKRPLVFSRREEHPAGQRDTDEYGVDHERC